MAQNSKDNTLKNQQEQLIEKALKTSGFLFPATIEEVKEFERIYGTTEIILPEELREPFFLDQQTFKTTLTSIVPSAQKLAFAARGATVMPTDQITKEMASDRRKADAIAKDKKNGTKLK